MQTLCVKYRLFPSKEQTQKLEDTLETCRHVYNSLVNDRVFQYETAKRSPSRYEQQKMFPQWSQNFPEVKAIHSQVLQNISVRVDLAFRAFFQRIKEGKTSGFPRLKGKGQYDSITYPQSGFKVGASSVWLSLQGKQTQVKAKLHRAITGRVKTCTVRRYGSKWFVCFSVEQDDNFLPPCEDTIGLDAGLISFMALSNGEFIDNPRFFRRDEKALAKAGRKQAKTRKGSKERKKANKVLSRIHERVRNRRHNLVHQTARRIVNRFGIIAVEKLNVKNMSKAPAPKPDPNSEGQFLPNGASAKTGLNKSIADASWSMFRTVLTHKAESANREVIAVNPAYTSQDCSVCGYRPDGKEGRTKKKLSDRWHNCPICTASLDRDTNAAINILNLALRGTGLDGITSSQVTPVEAPCFSNGE